MLNFIKTILGFIFFSLVFALVIIKNGPKNHVFIIEQAISYPSVSYIEYLKSTDTKKEWIASAFSKGELATAKIDTQNIIYSERSEDEFGFSIPTNKNFTLEESWIFSRIKQKVQLQYRFNTDIKGQIFLLWRPYFKDSLRGLVLKRLQRTQHTIKDQYQQHRFKYKGETTLPLTYYLALEGNSSWADVETETATGFQTLKEFAKIKNIPIRKDSFLVYPKIGDNEVRWRAAIKVDRYYKTNSSLIKCKRFKGGKALQLEHQGPKDYLIKSWNVLRDSLRGKVQAYPAIQKINFTNNEISNPLNWTTQLYIPIQ